MDLFHRIAKWSDRVPSPGAGSPLPGQGVPGGAVRPAGPGLPGACLGRAVQRRGRGVRADAHPLPDDGPPAAGPGRGGEGHGAAGGGRAAHADRRLQRLVGRGPGGPRQLRRAGAGARLPEWRRPRLPPARTPDFLPAHPQGGAQRVGPRLRGGHAVRLPPQLRRRADLQRDVENRPGRHRPGGDWAQPRSGRRPHRRQRLRAPGLCRWRPRRQADALLGRAAGQRGEEGPGAGRLVQKRRRPDPPLPAGAGALRGRERRGARPGLRRRRRQLGGPGGEGHDSQAPGTLARPGAAGLPWGGRALRDRGQAASPRPRRCG